MSHVISTPLFTTRLMEIATNVGGQRDQAYCVKVRSGRYANRLLTVKPAHEKHSLFSILYSYTNI